jgi:ATP-dependent RNA helicase HelY
VKGWSLTDKGERLRFVYNELDLLLAETAERRHLADLAPAQLAAVVSLFTFEPRRDSTGGGLPDDLTDQVAELVWDLSDELAEQERALGLPLSREPEAGFAQLAHDWTLGGELDDLFGDDDAAAGDFVRNCRQLLDLLRQLRDAYPHLRGPASEAVKAIDRGVVAAGGQA